MILRVYSSDRILLNNTMLDLCKTLERSEYISDDGLYLDEKFQKYYFDVVIKTINANKFAMCMIKNGCFIAFDYNEISEEKKDKYNDYDFRMIIR